MDWNLLQENWKVFQKKMSFVRPEVYEQVYDRALDLLLRYEYNPEKSSVASFISGAIQLASRRAYQKKRTIISLDDYEFDAEKVYYVQEDSFDAEKVFNRLTEKEKQVLELVLEDCSNVEIARRLDISEGTVRNIRAEIKRQTLIACPDYAGANQT